MKNIHRVLSVLLLGMGILGCSKKEPALVVIPSVQKEELKPSLEPGKPFAHSVRVTMQVALQPLLDQEFLYGSDVQHTSIFSGGDDLFTQALAVGHVPARFRVVGSELQLIADTSWQVKSDINHPEKLITRFQILSRQETRQGTLLTLAAMDSKASLQDVVAMIRDEKDEPVAPFRDTWVRSFEFVQEGGYLLQETSVMLADGKIVEFMESIFPRSTLKPSESFEIFKMDPSTPAGGSDTPNERYRLLSNDKVAQDGEIVSFAQHYDLPKGATIDWYVTRNIPDEFLAPVSQGVEGWNRYFEKLSGIERKVLRFMGRLPEDVRLGDPRYNVIVWDSVKEAGAAYESQAGDPLTGKQSHSLIYLPAAWFQIGFDYWKQGAATDGLDTTERKSSHSPLSGVACLRDLHSASAALASARLNENESKIFGVQLLKQTLLHEVGHALGLDHNFKGSLSMDKEDGSAPFSTSIMDYNDYEIERAAFASVNSADGPVLEYDRQILSFLYNKGKDIKPSDAELPVCNDKEVEAEESGVDPLCQRYDSGKDPTSTIQVAWERLTLEARAAGDSTLAQALQRLPRLVLPSDRMDSIKTKEDFKAAIATASAGVAGTQAFFVQSSKRSFSATIRQNIKSLLLWEKDILPEGYEEAQMRDRTFTGVLRALDLKEMPAPVAQARMRAVAAIIERLKSTPYVASLDASEAEKALKSAEDKISKSATEFDATGLPKLRSSVLSALARKKSVPYFLGKLDTKAWDFEASIVSLLSDAASGKDSFRKGSERLAAAKALKTFDERPQGEPALAALKKSLEAERATASTNEQRELIESLLKAI